jgi:hypothetical protein
MYTFQKNNYSTKVDALPQNTKKDLLYCVLITIFCTLLLIRYNLNLSIIETVFCEEFEKPKGPSPHMLQYQNNPNDWKENLWVVAGISVVVILGLCYVGWVYGFSPPIEDIIDTEDYV